MKFATSVVVLMLLLAAVTIAPAASATSTIVQGAPLSGLTDVDSSATFTAALAASSGFSGPVIFTTSTPDFTMSDGDVLETTGMLSASDSPYTITGNDADSSGDTGSWSYILTVAPDAVVQGSPTLGSTDTSNSSSFATTLFAASGFVGPVAFTTSTPDFIITNGDELETTGPLSASGSPYTVTGTDSDSDGDSGIWTYLLTVNSTTTVGSNSSGTTSIDQISPTTGTVLTTSSVTFTAGPISVAGNVGPVTFVTTTTNPDLAVSSAGLISTSGSLTVGTYGASGTDSDAQGDSGTWTFTLSVTAAAPTLVTVTFSAGGGVGSMAPESASAPTTLSLNDFVRKGYIFVHWNTAANGTGMSYKNGALFPFRAATMLFARWKRTQTPAKTPAKNPPKTITFARNGGTGTMVSEIDNTPATIKTNHFKRAGYQFVDWNSKAKGTGTRFKPGASYPFKKSITLYAQWKKIPKAPPPIRSVIFLANGGVGSMVPETHRSPATLTLDHFARTGYAFVGWNTAANGYGIPYKNGATYPFVISTNLYAQWKKNEVAPPPTTTTTTTTIPGGVMIGPFASGSSSLSTTLKSQIKNLANEVQANAEKQITLYGFGDKTVPTNETNVALGRARAEAVATYLEARLAAIGLKGWTMSIAPANPGQSDYATVVATLS
jgi:uncharacterized repeat protein (TIGR02543 family)